MFIMLEWIEVSGKKLVNRFMTPPPLTIYDVGPVPSSWQTFKFENIFSLRKVDDVVNI